MRKLIVFIIFICFVFYNSISISNYNFSNERYINVEVKGYVKNQGTYNLPLGTTVEDLLKLVEPYEDSDLSKISFLEVLKNNQIIQIEKLNNSKLISINTATIYELSCLPGIGKSTAAKIIDYRNEYGGFTKLDDLKNISGIGDKKYEKIKQYICL